MCISELVKNIKIDQSLSITSVNLLLLQRTKSAVSRILVVCMDLNHGQPIQHHLSTFPLNCTKPCGPDRDRTDDLLNANQALSQLSYRPLSGTSGPG